MNRSIEQSILISFSIEFQYQENCSFQQIITSFSPHIKIGPTPFSRWGSSKIPSEIGATPSESDVIGTKNEAGAYMQLPR